MTGFLLDTNVVSEPFRVDPEPLVVEFLTSQPDLWLSSIVLHELQFGLDLLPHGRRRDRVREQFLKLASEYSDRVIEVGPGEARIAARFRGLRQRTGRPLHLADALIAGTAATHDLAIATRDAEDYAGLDLVVTNPWQPPPTD